MSSQGLLALCCIICVSLLPTLLAQAATAYYTITGESNNPQRPDVGKVGAPFVRVEVPARYGAAAPGAPSGADRPNARSISVKLTNNPYMPYPNKRLSSRNSTAMLTYYGQFVSHDINKRKNLSPAEFMNVTVADTDPFFGVKGVASHNVSVTRSSFRVVDSVREQLNTATAFVDLSVVYSTNETWLQRARAGTGGQLKMAGENNMDLPTLDDLGFTPDEQKEFQVGFKDPVPGLRWVGDPRGNQNPGLLAIRMLYMRNHNRIARQLAASCPQCSDEELFQRARRWNIATAQAIAFYEYVPQLGVQLTPYSGYKSQVDPGIDNFFSTVSYRYGHSEVTDSVWRLNDDGSEHEHGHLDLKRAFYQPNIQLSGGIEPILRGMAVQLQGEVEPFFAEAVQQALFGSPAVNASDLLTINLVRGRDHGIPGYNEVRTAVGLREAVQWSQVTSNVALQQLLGSIYGPSPSLCDAYICGLAEEKVNGSHFGQLFYHSMREQYERLRDGDRLYFENREADGPGFTPEEINAFKVYGLRDLILDNTPRGTLLSANVWKSQARGVAGNVSVSGAAGKGAEVALVPGQYYISWEKSGGNMRISVAAKTDGWVGFGIAKGYNTFMVEADMVIAEQQDGVWKVDDYWSFTLGQKPVLDKQLKDGATQLGSNPRVSRGDGWTNMTFDKPLKAAQAATDRGISEEGTQWIIYAWHPTAATLQQHPQNTRGQAEINWKQGTANGTTAAQDPQSEASRMRRLHGIFMATAFVLVLPMGMLMARTLRYFFMSDAKGVKASMFYMHMATQVCGIALATAGLGVALGKLGKGIGEVKYGHGILGITIMSLLYLQLVVGLVRPAGRPGGTMSSQRLVWDVVHSVFGPLVVMLGVANVILGVYLFTSLGYGSIQLWAALCATSVIAVYWTGVVLDRVERLYLSKLLSASRVRPPATPTSPSYNGPFEHTTPYEPTSTGNSSMPHSYKTPSVQNGGGARPSQGGEPYGMYKEGGVPPYQHTASDTASMDRRV